MKTYIDKLTITDDEGEEIATIEHSFDFCYKVKLADRYITPDELIYIAKVLDLDILEGEVEV